MLYRLTEKAYIRPVWAEPSGDRVIEADNLVGNGPGAVMGYDGPPGPHLEPADQEARDAVAAWREVHPGARLDVMNALPIHERITSEEDRMRAAIVDGVSLGVAKALEAMTAMQRGAPMPSVLPARNGVR